MGLQQRRSFNAFSRTAALLIAVLWVCGPIAQPVSSQEPSAFLGQCACPCAALAEPSLAPGKIGPALTEDPSPDAEVVTPDEETVSPDAAVASPEPDGLPQPDLANVKDLEVFKDECVTDSECGADEYCFFDYAEDFTDCFIGSCSLKARKCVPALALGQLCNVASSECGKDRYCAFDSPDSFEPKCREQIQEGESCSLDASNPCLGDLACTENEICEKPSGEGASCMRDEQCDQTRVYCSFGVNSVFPGVCTPKRLTGSLCSDAPDNFQCLDGFCLEFFSDTFGADPARESFCVAARGVGESCASDDQCKSGLICNGKDDSGPLGGICMNETSLIRELGGPCNPGMDACDRRRSLFCRTFESEPVCVQGPFPLGRRTGSQCTPGSPFSSCPTDTLGEPQECRRLFDATKKPYGTDQCTRSLEIVRRGELCNYVEYTVCESGTSCVEGPGISTAQFRASRPPPRYCMVTLPVGADCSSTFDSVCEAGSYCIDNTCTAADVAPDVPVVFSGFEGDCASMPCAPKLACIGEPFSGVCEAPSVVVGLGELCYPDGRGARQCQQGLTCARGLEPNGEIIKRCRPTAEEGGFCENDDGCKGRLRCRINEGTLGTSKCFDPREALFKGAKCDPSAEDPCGIDEETSAELKCFQKGESFACQLESRLFEFCSEVTDQACAPGLVCNSDSICVPVDSL